jgi:hypothetical protein
MAMPDSVSDIRDAVSSALWSCAAARVDCAFRAFPAARQAARQCQWCWWRFRVARYTYDSGSDISH